MRTTNRLIIIILLSAFFLGCITNTAPLKIEKSISQNKLAYYNDSFDKLRASLWDKAGYIPNETQKKNFKLAQMGIRDGKLWVQTETGCFSKGGLGSKYSLKGDFDIQVDCHIKFLENTYDMDQLLIFGVLDKGNDLNKLNAVMSGLMNQEGDHFNTIFSSVIKEGKLYRGNWDRQENWEIFDGTLRVVRIGGRISTLFKRRVDTHWKQIDTFQFVPRDVMIGFSLGNFTSNRTSITAKSPIKATFDNFRINAAEEIIEDDI